MTLDYKALLNEGKEREMYENLIAALVPYCYVKVSWDLGGGLFSDIDVASVDISLFIKSVCRYLGVSVLYSPWEGKFFISDRHDREIETYDVSAIVMETKDVGDVVEYVKTALKRLDEGRDTKELAILY